MFFTIIRVEICSENRTGATRWGAVVLVHTRLRQQVVAARGADCTAHGTWRECTERPAGVAPRARLPLPPPLPPPPPLLHSRQPRGRYEWALSLFLSPHATPRAARINQLGHFLRSHSGWPARTFLFTTLLSRSCDLKCLLSHSSPLFKR